MSDEAVLDALVARLLPEYEQTVARMAERRARDAALSEDEWWDRTLKRAFDMNFQYAQRLEPHKEAMIRQRHAMAAREQAIPEMLARHRAEELLPTLLKIRHLRRAKGPITDNQYQAARMATSLGQIATMRKKLKEAAERTTDPRRKHMIEALVGNSFTDLKALRSLAQPNVTEERLEDVAKGIGGRFQALADSMREERE